MLLWFGHELKRDTAEEKVGSQRVKRREEEEEKRKGKVNTWKEKGSERK